MNINLVENASDHKPFFVVIKIDHRRDTKNNAEKVNFIPKPCWEKANNNQKLAYNDVLFEKLLGLNIPSKAINCKDISCNNTV